MPNTSTQKVVAIVLILIAAILFLWGLGILMMPAMMGSMMGGGIGFNGWLRNMCCRSTFVGYHLTCTWRRAPSH